MCPLCWTSLAITVTTMAGGGAATIAIAARLAKALARRPAGDAGSSAPTNRPDEMQGGR